MLAIILLVGYAYYEYTSSNESRPQRNGALQVAAEPATAAESDSSDEEKARTPRQKETTRASTREKARPSSSRDREETRSLSTAKPKGKLHSDGRKQHATKQKSESKSLGKSSRSSHGSSYSSLRKGRS